MRARVATIGTVEAGDYIVLEVADTGIGIPTGDPRADLRSVLHDQGSGRGHRPRTLAGAPHRDATSAVRSTWRARWARAASFTVYLPRAGDASDDLEGDVTEHPQGAGQRVLFVDDEEPLGEARDRDARGTRLRAGCLYLKRAQRSRPFAPIPQRLRRGDHRRAHAGNVGLGADSRNARHPAFRARRARQRLRRRNGDGPRQRLWCRQRDSQEASVSARSCNEPGASAAALAPARALILSAVLRAAASPCVADGFWLAESCFRFVGRFSMRPEDAGGHPGSPKRSVPNRTLQFQSTFCLRLRTRLGHHRGIKWHRMRARCGSYPGDPGAQHQACITNSH